MTEQHISEVRSSYPNKPLKYCVDRRVQKFVASSTDLDTVGLSDVEQGTGKLKEIGEEESVSGKGVKFYPGDVLFGKLRPYLTKGFIADSKGVASSEFLVLEPKSFTPEFLLNLLLSKEFIDKVNASTYGAKMPRASWDFIGDMDVPCPAIDIQTRVVDYINNIVPDVEQTVLELEQFQSTAKERAAKRREDLVTGGLGSGEKVDSGVGWIGEIPEHWDVVRTRFVAELHSGHTPSKSNDEYWEDTDIPWVSLADSDRIRHNDYISETEKYTNEKGLANSSAHILPKGTVVFTRDATVGLCSIIDQPMAVSQHIVGWVCGPRILPKYLLNVLKSMDQEYDRLTRGSTISTIGMHDIEGFKTPLPPLEEQREIVDHIETETDRLGELIDRVEETVGLLEEKRQALITAAVTGQIDVSDVKNEAKASHT